MTATATPVRERPILFSGPMVRAILDGRKTQTRRVVTPQPVAGVRTSPFVASGFEDGHGREIPLRYEVGDRLWVREAFALGPEKRIGAHPDILYRADPIYDTMKRGDFAWSWKPSIHMPRWASRITLEITSLRLQRMWEIRSQDIIAEGAVLRPHDSEFGHNPVSAFDGKVYLALFPLWQSGWNAINAKRGYGWAENPWVWAINFRTLLSERAP